MDQAARLVMVVDDDREVRRMLSQSLAMDGFAVVEARHGAEAVTRLSAGARPALILLDLVMPQMDGRAFLCWRAQDPVQRQIPVLLLSGHTIDEEERRELGVCSVIPKMRMYAFIGMESPRMSIVLRA